MGHLEKLLKEKPDILKPAVGMEEFEARVASGKIKKGYIIFVARDFGETSFGKKLQSGCLGPLGVVATNIVENNVDQKYIFAHVAIYVGKWEGIHYCVENGGPGTGKELLTREDAKKYDSAIRLIEAKKVRGSQAFLAITIPFGKVGEYHDGYKMRKRKIWPLQEELVQKSLASVGFPFTYHLRSRSCETFAIVLIGIGENDDKDAFPPFPQLEILLESTSRLGKLYIGSSEITENDRRQVEEFRDRFRRWLYDQDPTDRIDTSAFKVKGGVVVIEEQVLEVDKPLQK